MNDDDVKCLVEIAKVYVAKDDYLPPDTTQEMIDAIDWLTQERSALKGEVTKLREAYTVPGEGDSKVCLACGGTVPKHMFACPVPVALGESSD